jgi:hypothetical protein
MLRRSLVGVVSFATGTVALAWLTGLICVDFLAIAGSEVPQTLGQLVHVPLGGDIGTEVRLYALGAAVGLTTLMVGFIGLLADSADTWAKRGIVVGGWAVLLGFAGLALLFVVSQSVI